MSSRFNILAVSLGCLAGALFASAPASAQADAEPLARFEDPICPGVVGLKLEAAEQMVDRIREAAADFGRRLAPIGSCEANLIVAFVEDGRAFARRMQRENGWLYAELSASDRETVLNDTGPARAILRVRARSRDGMPIARRENLVSPPQTEMWMAHSKIYTATRNDILYSLVLIDREAVGGMGLAQLADYALYRSLSPTLPQTREARADPLRARCGGGATRRAGLAESERPALTELSKGAANPRAP